MSVHKNRNKIKNPFSDKVFVGICTVVLTALLLIVLYPLLYVVTSSFSGGMMMGGGFSLIPEQWTLEGYRAVLEHQQVWTGYLNTLLYTALGTSIGLAVIVLCAYPLSRPDFVLGKLVTILCLITMYFQGGLIPTFLWIKSLGLYNSMWALILPGALNVFNMIIVRTSFKNELPAEIREAANIDGCGEWRFLVTIALPLSKAVLSVVALYYAVDLWNAYFSAMIYIKDVSKLPLANVLREILIVNSSASLVNSMNIDDALQALMAKRAEVMKYSLIVISSVPLLLAYPFVQRYFVKGVMIGSVKG